MSYDARFTISGIDRLAAKLHRLPDELTKKVCMGAVRKGAAVIQQAAIVKAMAFDDPTTREVIAKNVAVRFSGRRYKRTGDIMYRTGIFGGAVVGSKGNDPRDANPGGTTFHFRFLEFGTVNMAAQPFMRPAMHENAQAVFDTISAEMTRRLDRLQL